MAALRPLGEAAARAQVTDLRAEHFKLKQSITPKMLKAAGRTEGGLSP